MIVCGDFNSNLIWKRTGVDNDHQEVLDYLSDKNIHSSYHHFYKEEQGKESIPTYYHYHQKERPFHIDFCFLSQSLMKSNLSKVEQKRIHDFAKDMEEIQIKSIESFISNNRTLAINAITLQKNNSEKISKIRSSLENKKQIPLAFFDVIYMLEKILQSWSDITDLVKPSYQ